MKKLRLMLGLGAIAVAFTGAVVTSQDASADTYWRGAYGTSQQVNPDTDCAEPTDDFCANIFDEEQQPAGIVEREYLLD